MTKRIAVVTVGMGGIGTSICRALYDQHYGVISARLGTLIIPTFQHKNKSSLYGK